MRHPNIGTKYDADLTIQRLSGQLNSLFEIHQICETERDVFTSRLYKHFVGLFQILRSLYGHQYDFFFHLEKIVTALASAYIERPAALKEIDQHRLNQPDWYQSQNVVGGALYVDLFSENLGKLRDHIGYFQNLGLTYLHLMPLFAVRPGNNDGGYAISNYRSVDPRVGTLEDLVSLAADLRQAGIVLVLDFVFNHTADDHAWAQQAQAGEREFEDYYLVFPDRTIPDEYEKTLREIFPTVRRGNFTWHEGMQKWVWTTFNSFQWDLNYSNPSVFCAMMQEMLFIANQGVDILRLDAVAFIWKEVGTSCENLPQAHMLIQAFNIAAQIAAPALIFKSEAIVHPDEVIKYIAPNECRISYNPTLMALLWESLATRSTKLLTQSLSHRHHLPDKTAWVNYLRCHDDIGWTFDDADAAAVGINAYDHRQFLNNFYTGQYAGSFARGVPFQYNTQTGDMRISGTMASLAGLEQGIDEENSDWIEMSVRRILFLHSVAFSVGGIPLIYLGEEWGVLNDYDFVKDPAKAGDSRWIHRPRFRWEYLESLTNDNGLDDALRRRIYNSINRLIRIRRNNPAFAGSQMELISTDNEHVLGFVRQFEGHRTIVLANFSEQTQRISGNRLRLRGLGRFFQDLVTGRIVNSSAEVILEAYDCYWLQRI